MQTKVLISETDLASRIQLGDEGAYRIAFNTYSSKLYNYSFSFLKNREQAEEVVQEVFLDLWLNREKLDAECTLAPLLYVMARRRTLNALRSIARSHSAMEKHWSELRQFSNETEESVFSVDLEGFTEKVLQTLPRQQQLVFRMSRQEGLSYGEIAENLNISRNTVRNHLVSALRTIRYQVHKVLFLYLFFCI
jgi:RNA polymerase sigma-70 factor (family 1)